MSSISPSPFNPGDTVIPAYRMHGSIINIAVWEKGPNIHVNELMYNEVEYIGAALFDEMAFKEVIQALNDGVCD